MNPDSSDRGVELVLSEFRTMIRLGVQLCITLLLCRCFLIEPNHIPSGSMAPGRLGIHQHWICQSCQFPFNVGVRPDHSLPVAICPNCAERNTASLLSSPPVLTNGDSIWVNKTANFFQTPNRWQEVVFFSPDDPLQPYLKRVVGLPGESVQINQGDVWIHGQRLKKNLRVRHSMAVPVFRQSYVPQISHSNSRWHFSVRSGNQPTSTGGWNFGDQGRLILQTSEPIDPSGPPTRYSANYQHVCPTSGQYGPVCDFLAYNGRSSASHQTVNDLWFEVEIRANDSSRMQLRLSSEKIKIVVDLSLNSPQNATTLWINDREFQPNWSKSNFGNLNGSWNRYELSCVDHQLEFLINGHMVFDPISLEGYPDRRPEETLLHSPVGFSLSGDSEIRNFSLYRDIYYTDRMAEAPVLAQAVKEPVQLSDDGYFVLGDNSGFSVDSRFWAAGPEISLKAMVGIPVQKPRQSLNWNRFLTQSDQN